MFFQSFKGFRADVVFDPAGVFSRYLRIYAQMGENLDKGVMPLIDGFGDFFTGR